MPRYAYKARPSPGKSVQGMVDAPGRVEAIGQLQAMGYALLSLEEIDEAGGREGGFWQPWRRVRTADLALFWRQLASLLEAGLPLVKAMATVEQQTENPRLASVLFRVRSNVENASCLSDAMARFPQVFGTVAVSIIAAGEAMGRLSEVADQLARNLEKEQDLRGKLRSALVYPGFLAIVGLAVIFVLVTFVIPRFAILFEGMGQQLPLPTQILLAVSAFARQSWWMLLGGGAVITIALIRLARTRSGRMIFDRLKLQLPVIGRVIRKIEMARFAHTLGTLTGNGVQILPAFEITARIISNQVIAREIVQVRERIAKGSRVEAALRKGACFPPTLVNMVAVGEDSAALDQMLEKVGTVFERDSDRVVGTMAHLLESVLILALGALVAVIVAAILLPIFKTTAFVE